MIHKYDKVERVKGVPYADSLDTNEIIVPKHIHLSSNQPQLHLLHNKEAQNQVKLKVLNPTKGKQCNPLNLNQHNQLKHSR